MSNDQRSILSKLARTWLQSGSDNSNPQPSSTRRNSNANNSNLPEATQSSSSLHSSSSKTSNRRRGSTIPQVPENCIISPLGSSRRPSLFQQTSRERVEKRNVTICGPMGVGKTSICEVLCNPDLAKSVKNSKSYKPTIYDEYKVKTTVDIDEGVSQQVELKVLDTQGTDSLNVVNQIPEQFVTDKDGFIFVYDVTCSKSFRIATNFLEKLLNSNIEPDEYAIILVGNKKDKKEDPKIIEQIEREKQMALENDEDYRDERDLGIVDDALAWESCEENLNTDPHFISATNPND